MSSYFLHLHFRQYAWTGSRRHRAMAILKRCGKMRWLGSALVAVKKWALMVEWNSLWRPFLIFSVVMSTFQSHISTGTGSLMSNIIIVRDGHAGAVSNPFRKGGEQPRKGSGSFRRFFCWCSSAALVRLCWKDPRSCHMTRYTNGSIPTFFSRMCIVSAMGKPNDACL